MHSLDGDDVCQSMSGHHVPKLPPNVHSAHPTFARRIIYQAHHHDGQPMQSIFRVFRELPESLKKWKRIARICTMTIKTMILLLGRTERAS